MTRTLHHTILQQKQSLDEKFNVIRTNIFIDA